MVSDLCRGHQPHSLPPAHREQDAGGARRESCGPPMAEVMLSVTSQEHPQLPAPSPQGDLLLGCQAAVGGRGRRSPGATSTQWPQTWDSSSGDVAGSRTWGALEVSRALSCRAPRMAGVLRGHGPPQAGSIHGHCSLQRVGSLTTCASAGEVGARLCCRAQQHLALGLSSGVSLMESVK